MLHAVTGSRPGGGMHPCSDTCDHRMCHLVPSILLSFPYKLCTRACVGPALTGGQSVSCRGGRGGGMSAYIAVGALVGCAELCRPVGMG